jgi:hypothetical protein
MKGYTSMSDHGLASVSTTVNHTINDSLREKCADLYVVAEDGQRIPCSKYLVLSSCKTLETLTLGLSGVDITDDLDLSDEEVKEVCVPFPSEPLRKALDVVHNTVDPLMLSLDEAESALRGMNYLDCPPHLLDTVAHGMIMTLCTLSRPYHIHLRKVVSGIEGLYDAQIPVDSQSQAELLATVFRNAHLLFSSRKNMRALLKMFLQQFPTWCGFKHHILVPLSESLGGIPVVTACDMIGILMTTFPLCLLIPEMLDVIAQPLCEDHVAALLGIPGSGVYYHPGEMEIVIDKMETKLKASTEPSETSCCSSSSSSWMQVLHNIKIGLQLYDAIPMNSMGITGSTLLFDHISMASVAIHCPLVLQTMLRLRAAPWLSIVLHPITGMLTVQLRLRRLDSVPRCATELQMRVVVMSSRVSAIGELWYVFNMPAGPPLQLVSTQATHVYGDENTVKSILSSTSLRWIRIDIFFGAVSVLKYPLQLF